MLPDDVAIRNVSAYIAELPGHESEATVAGDANRGRSLYTTCAACHGTRGQGNWALNAPRLADMSDWYLVRQLGNFQHGIRGAHRQDYYGWQMATMADSLADETAINDIVAYINTLKPDPARTAMTTGRGN
jgi:cytochrome c oxidase subunit 2